MVTYDVLMVADHFILVTTVEMDEAMQDKRDIESEAWKRLGAEYGIDWASATRKIINQLSIEIVPNINPNEQVPTPEDKSEAGQDDL
jgi:uncharacterized protein YidB (DUF937 family)